MWKIVIGFGSVIFFIAMIGIAVYFIKQYLDEKKGSSSNEVAQNNQLRNFKKGLGPLGPLANDILGEIDECINFLLSLSESLGSGSGNCQAAGISNLKALSQEIISPLEKMMHIIERYPDKSKNMQDMTEYLIPLIKKLADDYCFYYRHSDKGNNSNKAMETCEEGLRGISKILYTKADSMLEDQFYDIHAEVAALLQIHSADVKI